MTLCISKGSSNTERNWWEISKDLSNSGVKNEGKARLPWFLQIGSYFSEDTELPHDAKAVYACRPWNEDLSSQ